MKKILIFSNHVITIKALRVELVNALVDKTHKVILAMPKDNQNVFFEDLGCEIIETSLDRRGTNPIADLKLLLNYMKIIKDVKPDVVLTYTIKPNVYGGLACLLKKTPYLANITGLGTAVENGGIMAILTKFLYKIGLCNARTVFFQNSTNEKFFKQEKVVKKNTRLLPGSGVNLEKHPFEEFPQMDQCIKFLFVGRIMKDKGINELLEAFSKIKQQYHNAELSVVGMFDEDEYKSQLENLENQGILKYLGQRSDVHDLIKKNHVVVLPSYHEGLANVLLEAAACGRPVIATDVAGCRETYDDGISGLSCKAKESQSLYNAMEQFIKKTHEEKILMGIAGRQKVEKEFDRTIVVDAYIEEIERIIGE